MSLSQNPLTTQQLAERLQGKIIGSTDILLYGVGSLAKGQTGEIGFLAERSYRKQLAQSALSAVLVSEAEETAPASMVQIVVSDVKGAWRLVLEHFAPKRPAPHIHETAIISQSALIGEDCTIGAGVVIEENAVIGARAIIGAGTIIGQGVQIGDDAHLDMGVKILPKTKIGHRVRILAGAVLGSRGFGLHFEGGRWRELPQLGGVWIGDDVEIGACTTIDCGAIGDTCLEDGVKLDNHVQVAHNVHIGAHTIIAGCTVIAGSVTFGKYCVVGGASVFAGHIEICDGAQFTGHSSVSKSITIKDTYSSALTVMPMKQWARFVGALKLFGRPKA
ncbi:MAG: UDP-3-O-(3-hydroxymyristoyl)glucosamine N-acyltransferase [Cardiobacteriaceae bacterium]|nr:UDP-3-O-(3-hydroxymyristoyl)glucosamine N-acyltransferase [Cardiobacteriaceae bacterium]